MHKSPSRRRGHDLLQTPVLQLNALFEPVGVISAKRAMTLLCKEAAVVQDESDLFLRTSTRSVPIPSVIRLIRYRYVPRRTQPVSRKGVFLRDGYRCNYCDEELSAKELTLDHVVPLSKGGVSSWSNLSTCCYDCNNLKGDKLLEETTSAYYFNDKGAKVIKHEAMILLRKPSPLGLHAKHRLSAGSDKSWDRYLFV